MVDSAFSEYIDQCNGAMWLLGRKWVELGGWGSVGGARRVELGGWGPEGGARPFRALYLQTILARQEGLEPPTPGLEGPCSIQLSYCRAVF